MGIVLYSAFAKANGHESPVLLSCICMHSAEQGQNCNAGFQLVDGKERILVVEGLADGAMQRVEGIAVQALAGALSQPAGTCRRAVHWHKDLRYGTARPQAPVAAFASFDCANLDLYPLVMPSTCTYDKCNMDTIRRMYCSAESLMCSLN